MIKRLKIGLLVAPVFITIVSVGMYLYEDRSLVNASPDVSAVSYKLEPTGNSLVDEINRTRIAHGALPLRFSPVLSRISMERTRDMIDRSYYAHQSPEGTYFYDIMKENTLSFSFACENVDLSYHGSDQVFVANWMNSKKGHRECLLDEKVTEIGAASSALEVAGQPNAQLATMILSN